MALAWCISPPLAIAGGTNRDLANVLADLECEVVLSILPLEFESNYSHYSIPAQTARSILEDLGFSDSGSDFELATACAMNLENRRD